MKYFWYVLEFDLKFPRFYRIIRAAFVIFFTVIYFDLKEDLGVALDFAGEAFAMADYQSNQIDDLESSVQELESQ